MLRLTPELRGSTDPFSLGGSSRKPLRAAIPDPMARISIQIGARVFGTKTEAKNFARSIMARYSEGETITSADDLFLRDLIAIHPEATAKKGCGMSPFTSQLDPAW